MSMAVFCAPYNSTFSVKKLSVVRNLKLLLI